MSSEVEVPTMMKKFAGFVETVAPPTLTFRACASSTEVAVVTPEFRGLEKDLSWLFFCLSAASSSHACEMQIRSLQKLQLLRYQLE